MKDSYIALGLTIAYLLDETLFRRRRERKRAEKYRQELIEELHKQLKESEFTIVIREGDTRAILKGTEVIQ